MFCKNNCIGYIFLSCENLKTRLKKCSKTKYFFRCYTKDNKSELKPQYLLKYRENLSNLSKKR